MSNKNTYPHLGKRLLSAVLSIITSILLFPGMLATPLPIAANPLSLLEQDMIEPTASAVPAIEPHQCILEEEEICQFLDIIVEAARRHKVEASLVMAIIQTESGYNPNAISPAGARGLMQLMPRTAQSLGVVDDFDPEENVNAGTLYFKKMLKKFSGDLDLALAAYNAGTQNVLKYSGVPPFPETQNYITKVRFYHHRYKNMIKL